MSDRASALAQLARGALGVALSAAATRGPLASKELKAVAEMVLTRGVARRAAQERASSKAAQETRDSARPIASASRHQSAAYAPAASLTDATDAKVERADDALMPRMAPASTSASAETDSSDATSKTKVRRREVAVPSSPLARVMGFGQLAAGLAAGTVAESARRAWRGAGGQTTGDVEKSSRRSSSPNSTRGEDPTQTSTSSAFSSSEDRVGSEDTSLLAGDSVFLTEANAERLAVALCRMRGAALKLGQMLSIQDESVVPPAIAKALERVREGADVMPASQLMEAIELHLGKNWRAPNGSIKDGGNVEVIAFSNEPLAAASIGQVHRATVRRLVRDANSGEKKNTFEDVEVCMKIQYPGVARSIHSDIDNLVRLVRMTDLLPRGLYVEHAVATAKEELTLECDYEYELRSQEKMRALLQGDPAWTAPATVKELSSRGVLTTAFAPGIAIDKVASLSQSERDYVGTQLLRITLRELFEFRFMQSDPNFANFLYCPQSRSLTMIDFGAAKAYPKPFVDEYLKMVVACAERDREGVLQSSIKLGFLTGEEAGVLKDAHCEAGFQVGRPFQESGEGMYDFTKNRDMTRRVAGLGKVMLKHRLTPPPAEAYSLHRKLSGSFLACMRLGARVPARALLMDAYAEYDFSNREDETTTTINGNDLTNADLDAVAA